MISSLFIVSLVFLFVFNNEGVMGVKIPKFTMKTPSFDPKGKFASVHHAKAAPAKMQSITTTSADVQTLLVYEYTSNKQCDGDANLIATIPFNLCMTGFSEDGKILGSGIYQFNSTQALPVFTPTYYREYTNADCTGAITYEEVNNYPSYCLALEDAGTVQSARFEFSSESDPSSMIKIPGISMEYFDTNEHCNTASTNPPASTTWVALNTCLVSDEQTSFRFNGCGNHKISVEVFSDANCQISTVKADSPLQETCIMYDDRSPSTDSGFYYNTYTFSKCT